MLLFLCVGRSAEGDNVGIDMEKSRGVFEDYKLTTRKFYVFVPRTLDGTDMKKELRYNLSEVISKRCTPLTEKLRT